MNPYDEAHLLVAAIRILSHQLERSPQIEEICSLLDISTESALSQVRNLEKKDIVEIYQDPFSIKVAVANHLEIEKLPKKATTAEKSLAKELEQFMKKKKNMDKKVESLQAELEAKKKSMFQEVEENLKKKMKE